MCQNGDILFGQHRRGYFHVSFADAIKLRLAVVLRFSSKYFGLQVLFVGPQFEHGVDQLFDGEVNFDNIGRSGH